MIRGGKFMYVRLLQVQISVLAMVAAMLPGSAQAQSEGPAPPAKPGTAPAKSSDTITVTGTRADVTTRADRLSFDMTKDLQAQAGGTLAEALRAVPGVEVNLEGQVSLRGDPGVKILVDGRESALFSGEGRANAINSMPAGQIERVEVITNPSAAMSPEGSGGIINLIMKKARKDTRYATIRGNVGGTDRYALSLNGVSSGSKLTLTGDLNFRRFNSEAQSIQDRTRTIPADTSHRESTLDQTSTGGTARAAVDYDFDSANRLSTELSYYKFATQIDSEERFDSSIATASYDRNSDVDIANDGLNGRVSWRRSFPGQEHELVTEASVLIGSFEREVDALLIPAAAPQVFEHFRNAAEWNYKGFKSEYKRPIGKDGSLNLGYNGSFNRAEWDYLGELGPTLAALVPVAAFTNQFNYGETIHAVFATYNFHIGKLEAMTGLRLEQVELDIDQVTDNLQVKNAYFRAYPTLHLGYDIGKSQKVRASYSRRIQRPQPQDLNPYTVYVDPLNRRRGNPFLRPQATDAFELSWQLRKGPAFYSLTAFYRDAKDGVTDIFTDIGGGVILTTRDNLATSRSIGVDAIANGKLTKTLTYNASATWQWQEIDPRVGGIAQKSDGTSVVVRGNLNWQPTPNDFFQVNGNYSGRQLLPQGYREPFGGLNLGYRRKVNDKLSLLATAQNVLDSNRFTTFFRTPTVTDRSRLIGAGRVFFVGATYTFGNTGGRPPRDQGFDFQQGGGAPQQ